MVELARLRDRQALRAWSSDPGARAVIGLGGFLVVYAAWQVFRWGGASLQTTIGDIAFWPVNLVAALLAFRVWWHREFPARMRRGWLLIGLGLLGYLFGDVAQLIYESAPHVFPVPSLDDALYLSFYPLLFAGVLHLPRGRYVRGARSGVWLDAATAVAGAGSIVWALTLVPAATSGGSLVQEAISIAYPCGDLVLILGLTALALRTRFSLGSTALYLFAISLLIFIVADVIYARLAMNDAYSGGDPVDLLWMVAIALMGASAHEQFRRARSAEVTAEYYGRVEGSFAFLPYVAVAVTFVMLLSTLDHTDWPASGALGFGGVVIALVLTRLNISWRESRQAERHFRALVEDVADSIVTLGQDGVVNYLSPSLERDLGYDPKRGSPDASWRAALAPGEHERLQAALADLTQTQGASRPVETRLVRSDGTLRTLSGSATNLLADPAVRAVVIVLHDITERVKLETDLLQQSLHDPLTGLPNRALIFDRLRQMIAATERRLGSVAVLFIDLDNFKDVNDSLGHGVGDELLIAVSSRLSSVIRGEDTVGRLGGDEFIVLAEQSGDIDRATLIAQRILDIFAEPFRLGSAPNMALGVHASIGVAVGRAAEPDDLLRNADIAVYRAKDSGKNRFVLFDETMHKINDDRLQLSIELRSALAKNEFFLVYQPIIDLRTLRPYGVEALLRWRHPGRGVVSPVEFIPLLEQDGFILEIGRWVLNQACTQGAEWERQGTPLTISVNASALQLIAGTFVEHVRAALTASGLTPDHLVIEITESVLLRDPTATVAALTALRRLGVRIAIDDFGTGYSSLTYLKQFPIDSLKIDRSFVADMEHSPEAATLVRTLVGLGKELGITTTAEGIEDPGQLAALRADECDWGQGFHIARPMDPNGIPAFISDWTRGHVEIDEVGTPVG